MGSMKGLIIIAPHLLYAVNIDGIVNIDNIAEHFLQQNIDIGNNGFILCFVKAQDVPWRKEHCLRNI